MAWKCDGCGATVQDGDKTCEYCGRHKVLKPQIIKPNVVLEKNTSSQSNDVVDTISSALDPVKNYQSSDNSIKPNFENKEDHSTEKILIGIVIVCLIIWLLS